MDLTTLCIDQLMTRSPIRIDAGEPLTRAHQLMRDHRLRHLPVTRRGELVGLLSLGDLHLLETLQDVDPDDVPVEDAMSAPAYAVDPDAAVRDVVAHMTAHRLGSAVVVERGAIVGIFTTTDALHALLEAAYAEVRQETAR